MLIFTQKELQPVLADMQQHDCAMLLVKDEGVYVMSEKGALSDTPAGVRRTVAYASGLGPTDLPDRGALFDASVAAVGVDDFAETLPLSALVLSTLRQGGHDLVIEVTATHLRLDLKPCGAAL